MTPPDLPDLVQPWPLSTVSPVCTVRVAAPAPTVLLTLAEELRRAGLHVQQNSTGLRARSRSRRTLNIVGIAIGSLAGADGTLARNSPFRVRVIEESSAGCTLEVGTAMGDGKDTAARIDGPAALSQALRILWGRGAAVEVGPWERRGLRGRRFPIPPEG